MCGNTPIIYSALIISMYDSSICDLQLLQQGGRTCQLGTVLQHGFPAADLEQTQAHIRSSTSCLQAEADTAAYSDRALLSFQYGLSRFDLQHHLDNLLQS